MAIDLANMTDATAADVLFKGMVSGIKYKLKTKLMNELEEDIDGHIENVLKQLQKMNVYKDWTTDTLNINITKVVNEISKTQS